MVGGQNNNEAYGVAQYVVKTNVDIVILSILIFIFYGLSVLLKQESLSSYS